MLVAIQTKGERPPLFFVHGLHGVMTLGSSLAQILGPDQPFYALNANGIDGKQAALENVGEMAQAYVSEIVRARPDGPLVIAAMCEGAIVAIEVVRDLKTKGRQVGPLILADPPPSLPGTNRLNHTVDPRQPQIAKQLHQRVRRVLLQHASLPYNDIPFDPGNAQQLDAATSAGVCALVALSRHVPAAFPGSSELILSTERAHGFLHRDMPWCKILAGPRTLHVLPWTHEQMLRTGRDQLGRLLKFILDEWLNSLSRRDRPPQAALPLTMQQ